MKSEKSLILIEIGYEKVTTDNKFFDTTEFCFDGEIFPTPKKVTLTVPKSYYKYGYPTTPGMNLLTSTIHR